MLIVVIISGHTNTICQSLDSRVISICKDSKITSNIHTIMIRLSRWNLFLIHCHIIYGLRFKVDMRIGNGPIITRYGNFKDEANKRLLSNLGLSPTNNKIYIIYRSYRSDLIVKKRMNLCFVWVRLFFQMTSWQS